LVDLQRISGHPSAASRMQDSERTPARDRCSTAGLRNQVVGLVLSFKITDLIVRVHKLTTVILSIKVELGNGLGSYGSFRIRFCVVGLELTAIAGAICICVQTDDKRGKANG